jgi:hypothetical protein
LSSVLFLVFVDCVARPVRRKQHSHFEDWNENAEQKHTRQRKRRKQTNSHSHREEKREESREREKAAAARNLPVVVWSVAVELFGFCATVFARTVGRKRHSHFEDRHSKAQRGKVEAVRVV